MPFTQIHLSDTAVYNTSLVPRKRTQTPGIHPGECYIYFRYSTEFFVNNYLLSLSTNWLLYNFTV